jgi:endonuclease III
MADFWRFVKQLENRYGKPVRPPARGAFELVLYENIGYLADEEKRDVAFAELKARVGTRPGDVLKTKLADLVTIAAMGGIFPELRAARIQKSAEMVHDKFDGDLEQVLKWEPAKAAKALTKFPAIGEPGGEKILLFCGSNATLAPESNGLRVLVRLGFAEEDANYQKMYRGARAALRDIVGDQCEPLINAHLVFKKHGQAICKRSKPQCDECALRRECPSRLAPQ